jgi:hypothetical protein
LSSESGSAGGGSYSDHYILSRTLDDEHYGRDGPQSAERRQEALARRLTLTGYGSRNFVLSAFAGRSCAASLESGQVRPSHPSYHTPPVDFEAAKTSRPDLRQSGDRLAAIDQIEAKYQEELRLLCTPVSQILTKHNVSHSRRLE